MRSGTLDSKKEITKLTTRNITGILKPLTPLLKRPGFAQKVTCWFLNIADSHSICRTIVLHYSSVPKFKPLQEVGAPFDRASTARQRAILTKTSENHKTLAVDSILVVRQNTRNAINSNGRLLDISTTRSGRAALTVIIGRSYWRTRNGFLRHAFVTNTLLMIGGFILVGYPLTGYLVTQ